MFRRPSKESDALSKDLKQRGFKFVGSTIVYAHMQAVGMVNDHRRDVLSAQGCIANEMISCVRRSENARYARSAETR